MISCQPNHRHKHGSRYHGAVLAAFFVLTFALSWTAWVAATAIPDSATALSMIRTPIFLLGVFSPGICAIGLTALADGGRGVASLLTQIGRWQVGVRWYLFAAGYIVVVKLTVALIHRAVTGVWPRFGDTPWALMVLAMLVSTWVQAGEELGWRGYVLPRLATRIGLGPASVGLGVIWASWHLPLFLSPATDTYGQSFPLYLLQVIAISVILAWLYWRADGSLLLVMLMHAAVNNTKDIVPSAVPGASNAFALSTSLVAWLTVGLLWVTAAYFLVDMRGADLAGAIAQGDRRI